jgi:hypothetical protein
MRQYLTIFAVVAFATQSWAANMCHIQQVKNSGDTIKAGEYSVGLLGGGSPDLSTTWGGGISVTGPDGNTCRMQDDIIRAPFYLAGNHILYLSITTQTSDFLLDAVDLKDCSNPWTSKQNFNPPRLIDNDGGFAFGHAETDVLGVDCLPKSSGS